MMIVPEVSQEMRTPTTSIVGGRLNIFYLLAFAPILLVLYSGYVLRDDFWTWLISFYAFLLLYIKKEKLSSLDQSDTVFRIIGIVLITTSFFAYFVIVRFYPPAQFYGAANYTIYVIGLFLAFFQVSALKEAFAPLFLVVGAVAIPFLGKGMEASLKPAIPFFTQIIGSILQVLGIPARMVDASAFVMTPINSKNDFYLAVTPACIGIYSFTTFSILIIVTLTEDASSFRTKLLWSVAGAIGTFFVNIVRVSFVYVVIYYFGYENWETIHAPIGYVMFFAWLGFFFILFSKRQALKSSVQQLLWKVRKRDAV